MKTLWGKDRQGECTITHHIGGAPRSTEKELAEERKKLSKKHQRQPILTGRLPNKSTSVSLLICTVDYLSLAHKNILELPSYYSAWNFEGVTHNCSTNVSCKIMGVLKRNFHLTP